VLSLGSCHLGVELALALGTYRAALLGLGFADLLDDNTDHVLLKILLVLQQCSFTLFEALFALLVVVFESLDVLVLLVCNDARVVELGFGVGELLL
jgi:hypothetical protein